MHIIRRVRVGSVYIYDPVLLDQTAEHLRHVEPGILVRIVNMSE